MLIVCFVKGGPETAINDMQTYMDMLNPDLTVGEQNKKGPSQPPPPPTFPPPPPPGSSQIPPPPPTYPAPNLSEEESAEFLKVKSNLRHVDSYSVKKEVCHVSFILHPLRDWKIAKNLSSAKLSLILFFFLKHIKQ